MTEHCLLTDAKVLLLCPECSYRSVCVAIQIGPFGKTKMTGVIND